MRGECSDKCKKMYLESLGGKLFVKAVRNMWLTPNRKYCRNCRYGIVIAYTHCPCCSRLFAVVPRNAKWKRRLVLDYVRY